MKIQTAATGTLFAFMFFSLACGCAPRAEQPQHDPAFEESMGQVCNVDELAKLDPDESPISIEGDRHEWMMSHVRSPDVIELITLMRVEAEVGRARMLRAAVSRTSQEGCVLADYYEQQPSSD